MAPDLLNVWKPWPTWSIFLFVRTVFRACLTWVSITWWNGGILVANSGAVGGSFLVNKRALKALTGHRYKLSISGSWTTW